METGVPSEPKSVPEPELPPFSPMRLEFRTDPYALFRRYRAARPIERGADGMWYLFRFADASTFLGSDDFSRSPAAAPPRPPVLPEQAPFYQMLDRSMLLLDPPDHTRIRTLLQRPFAPRAVERLRPRIEALAENLLDRVTPTGRIEIIGDFAYPLPVVLIADMLGFTGEARERLREWSEAIARGIDPFTTGPVLTRAAEATAELTEELRRILAARRDRPGEDLMSLFVEAEEGGRKLSEEEILANCVFLLIAGHETTAHLISNGLLALLEHPDQLALLRRDESLLPLAVEELLRFDSPVQFTIRTAAVDTEVGGQPIQAGERVCALLGAANRDPEAFSDPDRLDLLRPGRQHLGFGRGIHFCLGASLARLEVSVALQVLLRRLPDLRRTEEALERPQNVVMRRLVALPLGFSPT